MGDLDHDTRLEPVDGGSFDVELADDWRIWTLNGGYVAAVALRAAGAVTDLGRPASLSLQFLSGAVAGPARVLVESVRRARVAECLAVAIHQGGRAIVQGHVWAVDANGTGPEHDDAGSRPAGPPGSYPTIEELVAARDADPDTSPAAGRPEFPFWGNLDVRPTRWVEDWEHHPGGPALAADWLRFAPTSTFADPFLDAGRLAVALDLYSFPSLARAHAAPIDWIAPNIDLHCTFHRDASPSPWILAVGHTPVSGGGLAGFTSQAWSEDGRLLAGGGGQMVVRPAG